MKFRHNETGQIFNGEFELRMAYPSVTFPVVLDQNALEFANVSRVTEVDAPTITPVQRADYEGIQLVDGQWTDVWVIRNKYDNPVEQTNCEQEYIQTQWIVVRNQRDQLLKETDYTQLPDAPITDTSKAAFIEYRKQLRNITTQSDPFNMVWPEVPIYEAQP